MTGLLNWDATTVNRDDMTGLLNWDGFQDHLMVPQHGSRCAVTCSTAGEADAAPSMLPPAAGSPSAAEAAARLAASRLNAVARVTVSCSALANPDFKRANLRPFTQYV